MGGNLARSPLIGVFYAALLWFVAGFLPRSEAYAGAVAGFSFPTMGKLMLLAYAVVAAAIYAAVFSGAQKGGPGLALMLALTACGQQWLTPSLRQLLLGETTGVMTMTDTLLQTLGGCGATVLVLVLAMLLYKTQEKPAAKPGAPKTEPKYKLGALGLVIRMLALPVIYFLVYYLLWYFLFWRREAVYTFYTGAEFSKLENFMGELIHVLVDRGREAVLTLLTGLAYALFGLPLVLRMREKRVLFIACNALLCLTGVMIYLLPSPVLPDEVRMAHLPLQGAVLLVYGVLSGVLLHTAFHREAAPAARPAEHPHGEGKQKQQRPAQAPPASPAK